MAQNSLVHRRQMLVGSAAFAMSAATGCRQESAVQVESKPLRRDVPLRIALVGDEQDEASIRRGWAAVNEHPLSIDWIELNRADTAALPDSLLAAANKCDLVVYPLAMVASLTASESIVTISDDEFNQLAEASGTLFPALRNGVARYAGGYIGAPLGASIPALLSVAEPRELESWEAYDEMVEQRWDGLAAEPSAVGWAAAMFLWRSAGLKQWLFNREDFQPLVETEPYIDSLQLMVRTNHRYKSKHLTPGEIWSATKRGELMGGIGFPETHNDSEIDFHVGNMPAVSQNSKVLLDPFSPLISLTANCRQSATAKRFIQWISGGEGSDAVRRQVGGMSEVRRSSVSGGLEASVSGHNYSQWLATRLNSPVTIPTLQLLRSGEYYGVLDRQVSRALTGEATPQQALGEAAMQWQAITEQVGVEKQLRAWRRAQGMRA